MFHKRTFFFLEQLILKHAAAEQVRSCARPHAPRVSGEGLRVRRCELGAPLPWVQAVKITDIHEGLDFFFQNRAHALKLVDFLQGVVPIRFRTDKQLVSHDSHSNTYNFKYTFSVEIAPVCRVRRAHGLPAQRTSPHP